MAILLKPTIEEMPFRKKLHENGKTMAPHPIESFPKEQWQTFIDNVVNVDPLRTYYRYVFCDSCMDFTAETSWQYDEKLNGYILDILVRGDMRREGYGHEALRLMKLAANQYNIHTFYARRPKSEEVKLFLDHEKFVKSEYEDYYRLDFA